MKLSLSPIFILLLLLLRACALLNWADDDDDDWDYVEACEYSTDETDCADYNNVPSTNMVSGQDAPGFSLDMADMSELCITASSQNLTADGNQISLGVECTPASFSAVDGGTSIMLAGQYVATTVARYFSVTHLPLGLFCTSKRRAKITYLQIQTHGNLCALTKMDIFLWTIARQNSQSSRYPIA